MFSHLYRMLLLCYLSRIRFHCVIYSGRANVHRSIAIIITPNSVAIGRPEKWYRFLNYKIFQRLFEAWKFSIYILCIPVKISGQSDRLNCTFGDVVTVSANCTMDAMVSVWTVVENVRVASGAAELAIFTAILYWFFTSRFVYFCLFLNIYFSFHFLFIWLHETIISVNIFCISNTLCQHCSN